jgi:hypothetical protein
MSEGRRLRSATGAVAGSLLLSRRERGSGGRRVTAPERRSVVVQQPLAPLRNEPGQRIFLRGAADCVERLIWTLADTSDGADETGLVPRGPPPDGAAA